jgi:hypothetical protein
MNANKKFVLVTFLYFFGVINSNAKPLPIYKAKEILVPPNYIAHYDNTNDGSPSYLSLYNKGEKNLISTVFLGTKSWVLKIKPKGIKYFPPQGPENFLGLPLYISNVSRESKLIVVFFTISNN